MFDKNFKPVLRFMVISDVHISLDQTRQQERLHKALEIAYRECENHGTYKSLDALYVVGDFANCGAEEQMIRFKEIVDAHIKHETLLRVTMASHEYNQSGVEGATACFHRVFGGMPVDDHQTVNGFHFISLSCSKGCDFYKDKIEYAKNELTKARKADPKKPIFFFQHPHISDTVAGSINWGDDALYSTRMDFPQVIDFSGHSHQPINYPRSIHQKHFTSLGTGSLSYFELDEFDKVYGTLPPKREDCAQFLFVEADENGRVRVYPYDILTDNYFPYTWKIDEPWNPDSFIYTDERYKTTVKPYFDEHSKIEILNETENGFTVKFAQAKTDEDYVDDYKIVVTDKDGVIVKQTAVWSEYYFYNMPEALEVTYDDLEKDTEYTVKITANSFWKTTSDPIFAKAKTK